MRKIMVEAEISVDGAMGGENTDFWKQVFPYHSPGVVAYLSDLLFTPDALLMGKKTYESFAAVWPTREGKDADRINNMPKYVASGTLKEPLTWNTTRVLSPTVTSRRSMRESGEVVKPEATHPLPCRGAESCPGCWSPANGLNLQVIRV